MNDFMLGLFGIIILCGVIFAIAKVMSILQQKRLKRLNDNARTLDPSATITFEGSCPI